MIIIIVTCQKKTLTIVQALLHVANSDDTDDYSIITRVAMACDTIGTHAVDSWLQTFAGATIIVERLHLRLASVWLEQHHAYDGTTYVCAGI